MNVCNANDPTPEEPEVIYISPWAFLRSMLTIAWISIRHPCSTSVVDLATGREVDADDDPDA